MVINHGIKPRQNFQFRIVNGDSRFDLGMFCLGRGNETRMEVGYMGMGVTVGERERELFWVCVCCGLREL